MALVGPYLEAYDPEAQGVHEPAKYSVVKSRDLVPVERHAQSESISAFLEAAKHMGLHDSLLLDVKIEFGFQGGRGRVVVHGHSPNGGAISDESTGSRFGSISAFRADDVGGSGVGRSGVGPKDDREDDDDNATGKRTDDIGGSGVGRSGVGPKDDREDDDDNATGKRTDDIGGSGVGRSGVGPKDDKGDDDDAANAADGGGAVGMGGLGCPEFRCSKIIARRSSNSPTKVAS
ncbi:hypothetical protein GCG54_00009932 [Colletotrichum gloeosporioides]|uniref:Uncharacterized protein n=1 Tax=Colletotrichum gloeosporioides TaxID=474922 RepID=A0A8H4CZG5_COLGL|nr:uncharacterized protein GCG54_00009932 [Colletotrichum gloeosporioides]KAF3812247.1 hypothetical protein GCG54_00009932 [Colletotrichum gloeosporioides]